MTDALIDRHDILLLDLDGVVYAGPRALPSVADRLAAVRKRDVAVMFVTNNAARTPETVADHLASLGVPATARDVVTSAQAAAGLVADLVPEGSPVLIIGGDGLIEAVVERGLKPVFSADDEPAAVVQGFHPDVGWRALAEGAYGVASGLPWVASNTDLTLPTERGIAPGNGALIDVIGRITGRRPRAGGKPEPALFTEALHRSGRRAPLVVGDRLETDIAGAHAAGYPSLLVLTGVTSLRQALAAPPDLRPDYLGWDLGTLFEPYAEPTVMVMAGDTDVAVRCGGWTAYVPVGADDAAARLEGDGPSHDGLRALATAVWSAPAGVLSNLEAAVTAAERAR